MAYGATNFAPFLVYAAEEGFGNRSSIQDVSIVRAARSLRRTWPICHIADTTYLCLEILLKSLLSEDIGYGKDGHFLVASGSIAWDDVYGAFARALAKRRFVDNDTVTEGDDTAPAGMAEGLGGYRDCGPGAPSRKMAYTSPLWLFSAE
ncbi:hypothetical protein N7532_009602 [Penicillium argentinense]|uniref:Uncharacterized protein n=1 Tax=Penicillium argentinense TaxID=1131581 RepID=A0A9W9EZP6_9EURO|nr:uncharacterized protein N7532_009602 [Penicillium argentinense]KAJ5090918.1 hypothetical protein N7532_009602 [Penicillium argentinense]